LFRIEQTLKFEVLIKT